MTEPATQPAAPLSLFARAVGMVMSPKATFERLLPNPRAFGILIVSALVIGVAQTAPQMTEAGRVTTLQMQVKSMERMGMTVTPEVYQNMEQRSHNKLLRGLGVIGPLIALPIFSMIFGAIYWAAFNVVLGGTAKFKEVLTVVAHSQVIIALGAAVGAPIQILQGTMSMGGPFNFGALVPMLEENSTLAMTLSALSVFTIWAVIVTAIGLAVLYRRKATSIAAALIAFTLALTYGMTALFGSIFGRG